VSDTIDPKKKKPIHVVKKIPGVDMSVEHTLAQAKVDALAEHFDDGTTFDYSVEEDEGEVRFYVTATFNF
jgi:hypothetical protein